MKLQAKITVTLLLVSLFSVCMVGVVAYGLLMADFRQSVRDKAFENFQGDMKAYLFEYGALEAGREQEPFESFVRKRRGLSPFSETRGFAAPPRGDDAEPPGNNLRNPPGNHARRGETPPFHFLPLSPEGLVLNPESEYPAGTKVPANILRESRPIEIDGRVFLRVSQVGKAVLTASDRQYLKAVRKSLLLGIAVAGIAVIVLGFFLGRRLSGNIRLLTRAVQKMNLDRELPAEVPVRSRDEVGELAHAFNVMNGELHRTHGELKEMSIRDSLTGLFNRRHFDDQAMGVYHRACRYNHPLSIMVGDLDHFKKINDNYSHAVGDEVLRRVADILKENVRRSDIVARYGGEEFVILFPETASGDALRICEKLRLAIEGHPWHEIDSGLQVTMSMGLCSDLAKDDFEKMLAVADEHLYAAKGAGRNRVVT